MRRLQFIPFAAWIAFQVAPLAAQDLNPSQVFEKVKASVVVVKSVNAFGEAIAQGSGVKLPSGRIITNFHVVKEGTTFRVGRGSHFVPATIYAADAEKDLCLLDALDLKAPAIVMGHAATLKVGAKVYAVGSPEGLELSLSDGLVSQLRGAYPPIIQTTAAISPGSSGGGLFDAQGRLVGITSFYLEGGQNLNFALPVEWVAQLNPRNSFQSLNQHFTSWVIKGFALWDQNNWDKLLDLGEQQIKKNDKNSVAWMFIGKALENLNHEEKAIIAYDNCLKSDTHNSFAMKRLGFINLTKGMFLHDNSNKNNKLNMSLYYFTQALKEDPLDPSIWDGLGTCYSLLGLRSKALDLHLQAVRINPSDVDSWLDLSLSYEDLEQYDNAINSIKEALKIDGHSVKAWWYLGNEYKHKGDMNSAIDSYKQMLISSNYDTDSRWKIIALALLGDTSLQKKDYANAVYYYKLGIEQTPEKKGSEPFWNGLVKSYYIMGNKPEALDAVKHLRGFNPNLADKEFDLIMSDKGE